METTANQFERSARLAKAMKLIAAVTRFSAAHRLNAADVARYADCRDRIIFAKLAGVHTPSDETWALVVESLAGAERVVAQVSR